MTQYFKRTGCAVLALCAMSHGALADLNAQDVWEDWQAYLGSTGYAVTSDQQRSGNRLNINNFTMQMDLPEGEGTMSITVPSFAFIENGNGTVSIDMPASFPMSIGFKGNGIDGRGVVNYMQDGLQMTVSGTPEDMLYDYRAAKVVVGLDTMSANGEAMPDGLAAFSMEMTDVASQATMRKGNARNYDQRISSSTLSYAFSFDDPTSDDQGDFKGTLQGLSFAGNTTIPLEMDPADMLQMLKNGLAFDGVFAYASGNTEMQGVGEGESFAFSSASTGGELGLVMDASRLTYDLEQTGTTVTVQAPDIPFPISMQMAKAGLNLTLPVTKSETEQDFALGLTLGEFQMPDLLWSLFDGAGVLPRDPASIVMDLTGKAKLFIDYMDPNMVDQLDQLQSAPGELNALTINNLLLSMVGAELTGNGAFTFDNTDLQTFDGVPRPTGALNLSLVGGNGLLDKIVQMGFVSNQDAMGARMMMGMLAVPGDGPDTLKSTLEINEQGHVLANGQRIQ
ncbi:MAG: DUF2125 domain-containing protein [Sedimentitalea sp.]